MDGYVTNTLDSVGSASQTTEDSQLKPRIQSAVRTVAILLAVADSPNGLRAKEIMDKLGLSRQVTYHLIHTMHGTGIIRKNDNNKYVLGLAAVSIAEGFHRQLAPPEHLGSQGPIHCCRDWRNRLCEWLGRWGNRCPGNRARRIAGRSCPSSPGLQWLCPCTSSGKVASGDGRPSRPRSLSGEASPGSQNGQNDHRPDDLMREFERIRSNGYALGQ